MCDQLIPDSNLFQQLGLPLLQFNDDFSTISANATFQELFQCTDSQVKRLQFPADGEIFLLEDDTTLSGRELLEYLVAELVQNRGSQTIGVINREQVDRNWYRVTTASLGVNGKRPAHYIVSFTDITSSVSTKESHNQIVQAKHEWETTVDALQDIVTIQNTRMEIIRANRAAHELFGYQLGELKNKKCHEVFFGQDEPCKDCPVHQTGGDRCPHSGLIYNPRINKTFRVSSFPIFDSYGHMYQLVHVARDVSQVLKDESEKSRLMAAIEQTSESVVITDIDANIEYVNPAFEHLTGYCRDEVLGKNTRILKSGVHSEEFYQEMWTALLEKKVWQGKIKNRNKFGEIYIEDVTISPVINGGGKIVNFVALKRDVTREEKLEEQLHHTTKTEALGTLAGGIAHDFNNILSAMIGYGEIAKSKLDLQHPAQSDIQQMLDGGDRAVDLVKQILTFSRRESHGEYAVTRLQHVVLEIIEFLRPSLPSTIDLQYEIDQKCGSVYADASQLHQVMMNLCTNARQAIGEAHGAIRITLRKAQDSERALIAYSEVDNNDYLVLQVKDSGCGIERRSIGKLFDPFYTTKQQEQGTGLGLAVVQGIVQKHQGEIRVESSPGKGSVFSIYLPVDNREPVDDGENVKHKLGGSERIMVIDDEEMVANVTSAFLTKVGYRVTQFHDSMQAVMAFREDPYCCDLVITDMLMPNMTGAELSREMLSLRKELPIIMTTGYSENFDRERAEQIGLREFFYKPVKKEVLRRTVREVLDNG